MNLSKNEVLAMVARYIVIAIYGLDGIFGVDTIFLVYDIKKNCVCEYFETVNEAFLCCDALNNKDLRCHILLEAKAMYNNNKLNINSPYIEEEDNIFPITSEYLKFLIEKVIFHKILPKKSQPKLDTDIK